MSPRALRRMAAPLLVVAGIALFGLGAGGIAQVDPRLEASAPSLVVSERQAPGAGGLHRGVRTPCPQPHVDV